MDHPTAFVLTHRSGAPTGKYTLSLPALALTRSLGRAGIRVVRLHPDGKEASLHSRYCAASERCPNVHDGEEALLAWLLELAGRHPGPRVLLPASDDAAFFLGRHRDTLLPAFRVPVPRAELIETIIDKQRQYRAAEALGIPIPETHFPRDAAEVEALARRLAAYPYILKPNVAHRWRLASVRAKLAAMDKPPTKAMLVRDARELVEAWHAISRVDDDLMVQEVIGGPDDQLFTFLGYLDARSRPLGYCVRSKLRQMPPAFGYCTLTVSCQEPAVVEQSLRLLKGLRYHGIVGVEWKRDPATGVVRLIEINARAVNTSAIAPACGVDLPVIAFRDAAGETVEPVTEWQAGVRWIWAMQDVWAARTLGRAGQLDLAQWLRSVRGPRIDAVYATDDPAPFAIEVGRFVRTQGPQLARWLRHRLLPRPGRRPAPTTR